MRKASIALALTVLFLVSVIGFAGEVEQELGQDIATLFQDSANTFEDFGDGYISFSDFKSNVKDYTARSEFIFLESIERKANPSFIKLAAGTDMVMNMWWKAVNEGDIGKLKLANRFLEVVLIPQIDKAGTG